MLKKKDIHKKTFIVLNKTDHANFVELLMPDVLKAYNRHLKLADKMNKALDNYLKDTDRWFIKDEKRCT